MPTTARRQVVLDRDTYNEVDDQFALAHLLSRCLWKKWKRRQLAGVVEEHLGHSVSAWAFNPDWMKTRLEQYPDSAG